MKTAVLFAGLGCLWYHAPDAFASLFLIVVLTLLIAASVGGIGLLLYFFVGYER